MLFEENCICARRSFKLKERRYDNCNAIARCDNMTVGFFCYDNSVALARLNLSLHTPKLA